MFLKEQAYVCALADTGSMTLAAEKLFITQPALSTYIKTVEDRMGAPLFARKEGVYVPTYLGEVYLEKARKMLAMQDSFNLERRLIHAGVQGQLRIGVQIRRAPMVLCTILRLLRDQYPHIEPIIEEGNDRKLRHLLLEDRIDLMVGSMDLRDPAFSYRFIGHEVLLLAARANSEVAQTAIQMPGEVYPVADLQIAQKETFILPHRDQSLRSSCDRLFSQIRFQPKNIVQIRSIEAAMCLAGEGFGVAFNRSGYAAYMTRPKELRYMRVQGDVRTSELLLIYRHEEPIRPFEALLDQLTHALQTNSPGLYNITL